jgi:hypothetical protein
MFQITIVDKDKEYVLCSIRFLENLTVYEIMWKNIVQPVKPHDTMAHAHCMLDN